MRSVYVTIIRNGDHMWCCMQSIMHYHISRKSKTLSNGQQIGCDSWSMATIRDLHL